MHAEYGYFCGIDGSGMCKLMPWWPFFIVGWLLHLPMSAFGMLPQMGEAGRDAPDTMMVQELPEVMFTGYNRERRLLDTPGSVAMIPAAMAERERPVNLLPLLGQAPGVFVHAGTLNTSRITIRGTGARVPYATGKLRAYYGHIPLTNGSGISVLEHIDPLAIGRIDIVRGPAGSAYGAGLGGTIIVRARQQHGRPAGIHSSVEAGSFGLLRNSIGFDTGQRNLSASLTYSRTRHDGYRENNTYRRDGATAVVNWNPAAATSMTGLFSLSAMKSGIPSSIDSLLFHTNPRAAAANWKRTRGAEDVTLMLAGVSGTHRFDEQFSLDFALFSALHNEMETRPFDLLHEERRSGGIRAKANYTALLKQTRLHLMAGAELFLEDFRYRNHENADGAGQQGGMISNNREEITHQNLFVQADVEMSPLSLSAGLNLNASGTNYHDLFRQGGLDRSALYRPGRVVSPRIGANLRYLPGHALFASVSHGFSPVSLSETLTPEGLVNMEIRPEKSWSLEAGGRGTSLNNRLFYDLNLFIMWVTDLLVAERVGPDAWVGRNAGASLHQGLEAELQAWIIKAERRKHPKTTIQMNSLMPQPGLSGQLPQQQSTAHRLRPTGLSVRHVLTLSDFVFSDFSDRGIDYSGNRIPGVPTVAGHTSLTAEWGDLLYVVVAHQYTGRMPMNDLNSRFAAPYHLFNASTGLRLDVRRWSADLFFRLNNLFDRHYASMILVNAPSFGGAPPRYYYPGLPRHFSSGVRLSLRL